MDYPKNATFEEAVATGPGGKQVVPTIYDGPFYVVICIEHDDPNWQFRAATDYLPKIEIPDGIPDYDCGGSAYVVSAYTWHLTQWHTEEYELGFAVESEVGPFDTYDEALTALDVLAAECAARVAVEAVEA